MTKPQKITPLIVIAVLLAGLGALMLLAKPAPVNPLSTSSAPPAPKTFAPVEPVADASTSIRAAYLHAWAVRAWALEHLDSSHLHEVLTGSALDHAIAEVAAARKARNPARVVASHELTVLQADALTASVDDHYTDRSVLLDPHTHHPTTTPTPRRFHKTFSLVLEDHTWKIARVIGYSSH